MNEVELLLQLEPGQSARYVRSRMTGFMGNDDIEEYDILDAQGNVIAKAEIKERMQVRNFETTKSWTVFDLNRVVIRRS